LDCKAFSLVGGETLLDHRVDGYLLLVVRRGDATRQACAGHQDRRAHRDDPDPTPLAIVCEHAIFPLSMSGRPLCA
jgi:hypothetical protein